ncbi:TrbI/VirB10 family protein [Acidicapsa ligni]|uniref:TrbI/VirB10 family protein n=1 Tax=Acidicapsa ligni TaxID=542300 RepID=UPI0021DFAAB7|nr:TrbI/VirB10 family protein [Acidicapsa ligni]
MLRPRQVTMAFATFAATFAMLSLAVTSWGQTSVNSDAADSVAAPVATDPVSGVPFSGVQARQTIDSSARSVTPPKPTYTVPAGTKVLLQLRSAINTKSAKPGDGVYLESTFPVVVGTRVMIPAGVYVQGVVDNVIRGGRVKGRAQLNMHFTSIIFPNGTVVEIPGIINSLPGASKQTVNGEGNIQENGNKGRDVGNAAKIGLEGAGIGTIGGAATGHPLEGLAIGSLGGAAVGAAVALFTRGDDINIENGTPVEMMLQRPLILEQQNLATSVPEGAQTPGFVPTGNQQRPLNKPVIPRAYLLCPPGSLGCQ